MSRHVAALAVVLSLLGGGWGRGDEPVASGDKLRQALNRRATLDFVETPLPHVLSFLENGHGVNMHLDARALGDVGIDPESPVTLILEQATLAEALTLMLEPLGLTWTVHQGVIVVTTPDEEQAHYLTTVAYDVSDLVAPAPAVEGDDLRSVDALRDIIAAAVAPESWSEVGGAASLRPFREALIVSQTAAAHRQIAELLAEMRRVLSLPPAPPNSDAFSQALEAPFSLVAGRFPLDDLTTILRRETNLDVLIDHRALDDLGLSPKVEIRGDFDKVPLRVALAEMLGQVELAWVRRFDALMITTAEAAESQVEPRIYDVREFLSPGSNGDPPLTYGQLADLCVMTVEPHSWDAVGGPGSVAVFEGLLIFFQTRDAHHQIRDVLAKIQSLRRPQERPARANKPPSDARSVTCDLKNVPLDEALRFLQRFSDARIVLEERELADLGLDAAEPFSLRLKNAPLETALDLGLRPLGLTWYRRENTIYVTTEEAAEASLVVEFYYVGDLLRGKEGDGAVEALRETITQTVAPETWQEVGGYGSVDEASGILAVAQTQHVQQRVAKLLHDLRMIREAPNGAKHGE